MDTGAATLVTTGTATVSSAVSAAFAASIAAFIFTGVNPLPAAYTQGTEYEVRGIGK